MKCSEGRAAVYVTLAVAFIAGIASIALADEPGQIDGGGGGASTVGSVSSLMAAAMQTAGVYAQAEVLVKFREALIKIASLCYLTSICLAIGSVAVFGTYRKAMYLLIGPALFYFVIDHTVPVQGTQLQVGRDIRGSIQDQIRFMSEYIHNPAYGQPAKVS
jgi:hypothetical protein